MVNVRLDHHAIGPDLLTLFEPELFGLAHNHSMNGQPRLGLHSLDVLLQRRLRKWSLIKADSAKGTVRVRISKREGKRLVTQSRVLLQHARTQDLLRRHPVPSLPRIDPALSAPAEILVNERDAFRQKIEQRAHRGEFA